ncbi:hypothetical protein K439DRAFT_1507081, partial [Ramaria rubella]
WAHIKANQCHRRLIFHRNIYRQPFIQCEKCHKGHQAHLVLRNLNEFDITYLEALLNGDLDIILHYEKAAQRDGYGPLAPCNSVAAPREQKALCPIWHRNSDGILTRGVMDRTKLCAARFETYCPYDLDRCPYFLLVCRNPHSHLDPVPSKTPRTLIHIFNQLLDGLGWKLADATPRRIILDSAFMSGLQKALGWKGQRDPTLSDLHPSLGNADHAARLINNLRETYYPYGTGLKGAYHLLEEHKQLSCEDAYVRCVEEHDIPGEGSFRFVICMFKAMSELLVATKRPSIDTSFKRLHKWQEFEIEAWFSEYLRSIVVARGFTTSQSAAAHHILFRRIFAIVHKDTSKVVQFRHIHGVGFDTFMADGHKGQASGLILCCEEICRNMAGYCSIEWSKALHSLTPYKHLARMYQYCFSHFTRNVHGLRAHVSANVRGAMMSIASAEPLPDFEGTLKLIRSGGKKAIDWLKDKESSSGFALAALYQPASKIPIDVWKASP